MTLWWYMHAYGMLCTTVKSDSGNINQSESRHVCLDFMKNGLVKECSCMQPTSGQVIYRKLIQRSKSVFVLLYHCIAFLTRSLLEGNQKESHSLSPEKNSDSEWLYPFTPLHIHILSICTPNIIATTTADVYINVFTSLVVWSRMLEWRREVERERNSFLKIWHSLSQ